MIITNNIATIKYNGKIYRIEKLPFETQEQVMDRLWYIVKNLQSDSIEEYKSVLTDSIQQIYEKYLKVKYS